ncbi:hypothetical protein K438DRAFT_700753 [Mycena galopus ATCC 62051]|nr:hypothetical protein K438DRAFT_700753 [Mycena galopus ATCC 62051]
MIWCYTMEVTALVWGDISASSVSASTSSASSPGDRCARPSSRGFGAASSTSPGGGGSPQSFIAAYIVKSCRFNIMLYFGCRPTPYIFLPAFSLVWTPQLVVVASRSATRVLVPLLPHLRAPPRVPVPAALRAHSVAVPAPHGHAAVADALGHLRQRRPHVVRSQPWAPPLGLLALRAQRLLARRPLPVPVHLPPVHPSGAVGLEALLLDGAVPICAVLFAFFVFGQHAVKEYRACGAVVGSGVRIADARNEDADTSAGGGRCALCD